MSRSPETLKEPNWFQLAKEEIAKIPDFPFPIEEIAYHVSDVIASATRRTYEMMTATTLQFGGEEINIHCHFGNKAIIAELVVTYDQRQDRKPEILDYEMTVLQLAAKLLLQTLANQTRQEITYVYHPPRRKRSDNLDLVHWMMTTGNKIFHWKRVYGPRYLRRTTNRFSATISPQ